MIIKIAQNNTLPKINSFPRVISQDSLLDWPSDFTPELPRLDEPTANQLNDIHAQISDCDIVLSTSGNYHMALREIWQQFLHEHKGHLELKNWLYSTSPPVIINQLKHGGIQVGNLQIQCLPHLAVLPKELASKLFKNNYLIKPPIPIIKNFGNVMLVRKGNPFNIQDIRNLKDQSIRLATPNPENEPGTFLNFSKTIYQMMLKHDRSIANDIFNAIFNENARWVCGRRIMHREIPWLIASDNADVAIVFYHLAKYFVDLFPDQFDFIPLGGNKNEPDPAPGNIIEQLNLCVLNTPVSEKQVLAQCKLEAMLHSKTTTDILTKHGLRRPAYFKELAL